MPQCSRTSAGRSSLLSHQINGRVDSRIPPSLSTRTTPTMLSLSGIPSVLTTLGLAYAAVLAFFCWRHYEVWNSERQRVRRSLSAFRVLFLASLGTTGYLYHRITTRDDEGSRLEEAAALKETLLNATVVKMAKILTVCSLLLTAFYRIIRKL